MRKFHSQLIGVEQGEVVLFSDFQDDGPMWTGTGPRERRHRVTFDEPFREPPAVQTSVSLWDVDTKTMMRADLANENVTRDGFDLVFRTWADSRLARIRVAWIAIGEARFEDDWDLY